MKIVLKKIEYKYHYVYRITNIVLDKHYYGCRSSNIEPIKDLGFKYFSSSYDNEFILDQHQNPNNYEYKIIKIFDTRLSALRYEIFLHDLFDVDKNPKFYNKAKQTYNAFRIHMSDELRKKISEKMKGRPGRKITDVEREKMRQRQIGRTISSECKEKISISLRNRPKTIEHKQKLRHENEDEIYNYYSKHNNLSLREIAKKFNTYHATVKNILIRNGIQPHEYKIHIEKEICEYFLLNKTMSLRKIANKFNTSNHRIKRVLLKHNYIE